MNWWHSIKQWFVLKNNKAEIEGKEEVDAFNLYKPKDRLIYRYYNGSKIVSIDPMDLYSRIMAEGTDLDISLKLAGSISKDAPQGYKEAIERLRKLFEVKPYYDGEGLTDTELFDLFTHFLTYCNEIKKKVSPSATSQMEILPSILSTQENAQPIQNTLDSGLIDKDVCIAEQEQSQLEHQLH